MEDWVVKKQKKDKTVAIFLSCYSKYYYLEDKAGNILYFSYCDYIQ